MTPAATAARNAYVSTTVQTVSPGQLLVMLYDALVRNLDIAEQAILGGDVTTAHDKLVRAQDIVFELQASLKPEAWPGGAALAELYAYVEHELITANVDKDAARVQQVRLLVEPLAAAWREAAAQAAPAAVAS